MIYIVEVLGYVYMVPFVHNKDEIMLAKTAAKNFLNKTKNINVQIPEYDIIQLKRKSAELSIPYETILSSLIHQYVTGRIKPIM